ncbi:hypothetical protein A4R44_02549 [Amycolatopsis sp. M39]|nr:hypothetical protein A4R44_02549 [Amycolatopsis sp. M39]
MSRWGLTIPLTGVPLVEQLPDLGCTAVWSADAPLALAVF